MDLTPAALTCVALPEGRAELVEWRWPPIIDFVRTEPELMLEMSLPPHAADASAEFPEIDPGNRCFMGTLFVRFPGVAVRGRSEGGQIRVLRLVFSGDLARSIVGDAGIPAIEVLQGLLDIRSEALRTMMGLALREMTRQERSAAALAAIQALVAIELTRLFERDVQGTRSGRLAAWQYRRIRERLAQGGPAPNAGELAALCGVSVRHLQRQFLALTGTTVARYVTNFWVERAKDLLSGGTMPIKHVAHTVGFSHPNSFARAFRKAAGLSPHDFRQQAALPGLSKPNTLRSHAQ